MQQAKNYAAQAAKGISRNINGGGGYLDAFCEQYSVKIDVRKRILEKLFFRITSCPNFNMPDNGYIFGKDNIDTKSSNLPFKEFCYSTAHTINPDKSINKTILAKTLVFISKNTDFDANNIEKTYAIYFVTNPKNEMWVLLPFYTEILDDLFTGNVLFFGEEEKNKEEQKQIAQCAADFMLMFAELLTALSCKNVEQTIIQKADKALNDRRVKSGKLPLLEERILTIKVNKKVGNTGTGGGNHQSPRQHLRRGHIRRLESGNIWVKSCVVGDAAKGVINKQYKVVP
ncbi:MAG: hypothetical protein IPM57_10795 [Oligoflexia bacterium]|nr:hypothetical protein [Oligoflexia bacterium]